MLLAVLVRTLDRQAENQGAWDGAEQHADRHIRGRMNLAWTSTMVLDASMIKASIVPVAIGHPRALITRSKLSFWIAASTKQYRA